ncbi:MAG: hypothetical protein PF505_01790 [Vallitaleaceae bacterium]|jgi:multisubunit Na+/H+ antiporter MnhB subunit|nr:hypothetical protein [Vallitaleaceae bacterium]
MSDRIRRGFIMLLMVGLFFLMVKGPIEVLPEASQLKAYYMTHFMNDTGALNSVTGIYLNYRVFDTLFETLVLLVSVIGIIYFSRHEGDY